MQRVKPPTMADTNGSEKICPLQGVAIDDVCYRRLRTSIASYSIFHLHLVLLRNYLRCLMFKGNGMHS